jgi:hypothetical protein
MMVLDNDELEIGCDGADIVFVISAEPLENHKLKITLSNGQKGIFDVSPYLDKGNFKELQDYRYFQRVYVDNETVMWPHGQDIDPELIEMELQPEAVPDKFSKAR